MPDEPECRSINLEQYPYCVPSYDPAVLKGVEIESCLNDEQYIAETRWYLFEVIEGRGAWRLDMDDGDLQAWLQVLPPSPIYSSLSGPFLRFIDLQRVPEVAYLSRVVSIASLSGMESLSDMAMTRFCAMDRKGKYPDVSSRLFLSQSITRELLTTFNVCPNFAEILLCVDFGELSSGTHVKNNDCGDLECIGKVYFLF